MEINQPIIQQNQQTKSSQLQFVLIKNATKKDDLQILKSLTSLKCLYSKQLTRMPKEYIVKFLFDTVHQNIIIKSNNKILGGITFRGFQDQSFYQIAFFAVSHQNQCKGLGSILMNKFKNYCQQNFISHIFTYADDGAIGFFQKQGFSKNITLQQQKYKGFIKQYIGGQFMECRINLNHKIDFQILKDKIKQIKNNIIYKKIKPLLCLAPYQIEKSSNIIESKKSKYKTLQELAEFIPGLKEAGYVKLNKQDDKKITYPFLLTCQHFIQLAFNKSSLLKQGLDSNSIQMNTHEKIINQNQIKCYYDYCFMLYKLERKIKQGKYRYKDEFIQDFTQRLKQILPMNHHRNLREKQFLEKIDCLKYQFMKNQIDYQIKAKKRNTQKEVK